MKVFYNYGSKYAGLFIFQEAAEKATKNLRFYRKYGILTISDKGTDDPLYLMFAGQSPPLKEIVDFIFFLS